MLKSVKYKLEIGKDKDLILKGSKPKDFHKIIKILNNTIDYRVLNKKDNYYPIVLKVEEKRSNKGLFKSSILKDKQLIYDYNMLGLKISRYGKDINVSCIIKFTK